MASLQKLDSQEAAQRGATHEYIVQYTDLTDTASTAKTLTAASLAIGTRMALVGFQVDTLFDGGATSELTVKAGWDLGTGTDDDDGLLGATSIHADATYVKFAPAAEADVNSSTVDGTYGTEESNVISSNRTKVNVLLKSGPKVFNDTAALNFIFTSTGANLSTLTQGKIRFFLRLNPAVA